MMDILNQVIQLINVVILMIFEGKLLKEYLKTRVNFGSRFLNFILFKGVISNGHNFALECLIV